MSLYFVVTEGTGGKYRLGREVLHCTVFLCADDGLVASMDPVWLHVEFETLAGLFCRVGLHKNIRNTVRMICHPCSMMGTKKEVAYVSQMTGEGIKYQARQGLMVQCLECGEELAVLLMALHQHTNHEMDGGGIKKWETPPPPA